MATARVHSSEDGPRHEGDQYPQRVTYSVPEAAQALCIGTTLCRELIKSGELQSVRIGRRLLVPKSGVELFVARLIESEQSR